MEHAQGIKRERDSRGPSSPVPRNDTPCRAKRPKLERTFVPAWLDRYEWLRYDEQLNVMFCDLCLKHRKSNAFTEGCQNFRRDNLNKHANTNDHRASVEQNYTGMMGGFALPHSGHVNGNNSNGSSSTATSITGNLLRSPAEIHAPSLPSTKSTPSPRRSSISSSSEASMIAGRSMQSPPETEPSTPSPTPAHMPIPHSYLAGFTRALSAIHRPQAILPGILPSICILSLN